MKVTNNHAPYGNYIRSINSENEDFRETSSRVPLRRRDLHTCISSPASVSVTACVICRPDAAGTPHLRNDTEKTCSRCAFNSSAVGSASFILAEVSMFNMCLVSSLLGNARHV